MNGNEQRALVRKLDLLRIKGARLLKLAKRDDRGFASSSARTRRG
jgi:hypothetical protein